MNTVEDLIKAYAKVETSPVEAKPVEHRPWKTLGEDRTNPDLDSKEYFKLVFEARGYQVYIPEDRYSVVDIFIAKDYDKIGLELKSIDCCSSKWSDTRIDRQKIDSLRELGIPAYLILAWTDCFSLVNVATDFKLVNQYCHKTTAWSSARVNKEMYSIDNSLAQKFEYVGISRNSL